jgi:t-SNARE complex subunit (syntaxin)
MTLANLAEDMSEMVSEKQSKIDHLIKSLIRVIPTSKELNLDVKAAKATSREIFEDV